MGTGIQLAVVKVSEKRKRPWKVDVPASLAGKRQRHFFLSKRDAEKFAQDFIDASLRGGVASALDGLTVGQALTQYLDAKLAGVGKRQSETLKLHGDRIRRKLGPLRLASLTVRDIERFISRPEWSRRTQWNAFAYLRTFLRWCTRRELMAKNPAERLAEEIQKPESSLEILSCEEMRLLLGLTKRDGVMRSFVVLGAFAGLRSAELMRIEWADINRDEREIHVRPGVIKKTRGVRERYTTINATCARWLPENGKGKIIPHTQRAFARRSEKLISRMRRVMTRCKIAGVERWNDWPQNCLRHSFASYLLAVKQDAGFVAYQMGHTSADMIYKTYASAVRKSDAEKWWGI